MKRCIGQEVSIVLKSSKTLHGLLIEFNDEDAIIQVGSSKSIFVPRKNVEYYETTIGLSGQILSNTNNTNQIVHNLPSKTKELLGSEVLVSVNNEFVCKIYFPEDFNIASCSPEMMDVIIRNTEVKNALAGKVMTTAEYDIGTMNIITRDKVVEQKEPDNTFSFSFAGGQTNYKNQTEILFNKSKIK